VKPFVKSTKNNFVDAEVPSKETAAVVDALTRQVRNLPASLRRSLTWDRGRRWRNILLRQYFPRKTYLCGYSQEDLNKVVLHRPVETAARLCGSTAAVIVA
jgi:IS30 family transposase